ncbi:MAG: NAD-dependent epimerase/dehydratase family protein [Proteobacteria bacterium]|nr:NAD-dependent epimerase/dehydratase family protein [Pseudomonadota bacterium]MBU1638845.1 NAD-dependent epimerase/dehydratase family protein [Pseudomonadota bacterium]
MTERVEKILVTGGAGFIGSHLVERLLAEGFLVRILDNFSTGKYGNLPQNHPGLEIVEGDVADRQIIDQVVQGISGIVHLAAVASVQASVEDPAGTHASNFIGTLNLLEASRRHKVRRFLFASSAAVYGNGAPLPISEEASVQPLTPYASDKLASEYYLDFYGREYGLEPGIFRFFNVFGPRQDPASPYSGVISIFVDRSLAGQQLSIFGDGQQTRDFIYVTDLVTILVKALNSHSLASGPVNVGTGTQTSLLELVDTLRVLLARPIDVLHLPPRQGDVKHSLADISLLRERFSFEQGVSFSQGLKELVAYLDVASDKQ